MNTRACGDQNLKKKTSVFNIKGCKSSLANKQLLVSTGLPSLDLYLGGGIPVGSIILIEEDKLGTYSSLLFKYFLAEGVVCNHSICLVSLDENGSLIINDLPKACGNAKTPEDSLRGSNEDSMRIAWRYENSQASDFPPETNNHYFDLMKNMDPSLIDACHVRLIGEDQLSPTKNDTYNTTTCYKHLLELIKSEITDGFSTNTAKIPENVLRIGIKSLGSPLWSSTSPAQLCQTILALKSLVRSSFSVCFITFPSHLIEDDSLVWSVESMVDAVIKLESFQGTPLENHPIFKNYHGLLHVIKSPRLNSIIPNYFSDLSNLAFKLHRKQFSIEKFCLPPAFTEEKINKESNIASCSARDF